MLIQYVASLFQGSVAYFEAPKFDRKTVLPTKYGLVDQHFPASGVLSPRLLQEVPPGEKLLYNTPGENPLLHRQMTARLYKITFN